MTINGAHAFKTEDAPVPHFATFAKEHNAPRSAEGLANDVGLGPFTSDAAAKLTKKRRS